MFMSLILDTNLWCDEMFHKENQFWLQLAAWSHGASDYNLALFILSHPKPLLTWKNRTRIKPFIAKKSPYCLWCNFSLFTLKWQTLLSSLHFEIQWCNSNHLKFQLNSWKQYLKDKYYSIYSYMIESKETVVVLPSPQQSL